MVFASAFSADTDPGTVRDDPTLGEILPSVGDRTAGRDGSPAHQSPVVCAQSAADATMSERPGREDVGLMIARLVSDALKEGITELRKDEGERVSQIAAAFEGGISAFREGEENRIARLEKIFANDKLTGTKASPTTNFWTTYKKVADEYDNDMISKYVGDLDTSLLFAGLFSAVTTTFIVQIIPQIQPNPIDLTNALLLRVLQQNASFGGANPLAPISNVPTSVIRAQAILLASLAVTLFVAFMAVLGKQWIQYYTRVTTWGSIVDRGKEHQAKLVGLEKWRFYLIMDSLPALLEFALLLFGVALTVYLWDLNVSVAEVVLVVTSVGLAFYASIAVVASIWHDCPFQTSLSAALRTVPPAVKEFTTIAGASSVYWWKRKTISFLPTIERIAKRIHLQSPPGYPNTPNDAVEEPPKEDYPMTLSNPAFWRQDPLFTSPIPKDIGASAGFWLLENSTDFSAASAVAAVFSEMQWPSHLRSETALIRLRDMYVECFRAREFNKSIRLKALQSAAAYYILYHTQLIWNTWKGTEVEVEQLPSDLPPDLFLYQHNGEWGGDDVFEHLLRSADNSEPVTSVRFISYMAPYWFCGDSDATVRYRPSRLQNLGELIEVLGKSRALIPATLTDCILCVGTAMDFPLHPEDLIRVDKSDYFVSTFKAVVEHIHRILLARARRRRHAEKALGTLLDLVKKTTLPLVDAPWIFDLLKRAALGDMDDEKFTLFMRLNARKKDEETGADETPFNQDGIDASFSGGITPSPDQILFNKIVRNIRTCAEKESGWQDEAVYGGLIAMKDIPLLESCLPEDDSIQLLSEAMEKENKPLRVRKAAYDVVLVAQAGWFKSVALRPILEDLDIPRKLRNVVVETGSSGYQRSFLEMMESLSEDRSWHPYLRKAMDIWLLLHHEGPDHVLHILTAVGELVVTGSNPPSDRPLEKLIEDEWARVSGRLVTDLTGDKLKSLAEVTKQLKELSFTESDRTAVLGVVENVIPSLEKRREDGYNGPGEDIRGIVNDLLGILRTSIQSTSRRPAYW